MKNYTFKRLSLTLLLMTLFSGMVWAQIPAGYYNSAEGKTGQELRLALHNIIKNHTSRGYSKLGDYFGYTDLDEDGKIIDIYSNQHYTLNQTGGAGKNEGNGWNKEHTWPQSWMKGTATSDIFHIYPTDAKVNNMRSNYPYAEVKNVTWTSSNGCKLGTSKTEGYSGKAFEPAEQYKGDLARTYFYITTRYYTEDSNWGSSPMTNKCEIEPWAMKMLLEWHKQDPVSQKEIDRNNAIYNFVQYNRNPFIDHPEYAEMIWGDNVPAEDCYDITCATGLMHGSVTAPSKAAKGSTVTIYAHPDAGYMVDTWSVWKTDNPATTVSVSTNGTFTMPEYAVTVSATFKEGSAIGDFAKVTSNLTDWSGTYLIVYEDENGKGLAFDGSLTEKLDVAANTIAVNIENGIIEANEETNAATFTIEPVMDADGYVICSASGRFIGRSSNDNGMNEGTTPLLNDISFNGNDIDIVGTGGAHLRFNNADNQKRFRYYKSSTYTGQKPIQLYRLSVAEAPAITITYHNGAETYTQAINSGETTNLIPCAFTRSGYDFNGWNTDENGDGVYYEDCATVTLEVNIDLYAQWDKLYTVTLQQEGNGTVEITPTEATEETIITVTATPADGFNLNAITVTDDNGNTTELDGDEFEMPASNVTVKVVFASPATGISEVQNATFSAQRSLFDLQGRQIVNRKSIVNRQLSPGVYIRNGKKVIVR